MADDIVSTSEAPTQEAQTGVSPEIAQLMELSLKGPAAIQQTQEQETATQEAAATETQTADSATTTEVNADPFAIFKDKFGYQTHEDAIKEIEELRALKDKPQEFQLENEESKKLLAAVAKGDRKSVLNILAKQDRLDELTAVEVTKDNAPAIIKMAMQVENSDLTQAEIDFQYEEQYTPPKEPKEPVQRGSETDDEFLERKEDWQERHDEWKKRVASIETKISIAAKMAKPKLEAAKSTIVFPDIETETDEDYNQYLKMLEEKPRLNAEIAAAYKALAPQSIETKVKFTDEANKIDFEFQYVPDAESFNRIVEMVSDMDKLYSQFKNQDGTPDRKRFLETIYFGLNKDKIILEAIKQSKNATIKASLPDNSGGSQRQFPQSQELSEVDKLMRASLNGHLK